MRLATFNLMHGRSLHDGRVDPERLRRAIAGLDADVLALQEVDRGQPRTGGIDHTAVAAEALGALEHRFAAAIIGTPGGAYRAAAEDDVAILEPSYGVGLVTRWSVREWHLLRLRAAPVRSPIYVPGPGGGLILLGDEPRVVLAAVLESPVGPLTVATTHLSFVPGWNVRQLRRAMRWLAGLPAPRLLAGDLNLPAGIAVPVAAAAGWRPLARLATYPAPRPRVQFDHALIHPRRTGWSATARTPALDISDHRPLVLDLIATRDSAG